MSEGISAARTSASLFCIFYISFLLFVLVPFLSSLVGSSHLPLFCSSQRNSTTHCCRFALFFFIFFSLLPTALLLAVSTHCWAQAVGAELQQGSPPTCEFPVRARLLPALPYICCSQRGGVAEGSRGGRSGRDTRQLRASLHPGVRACELHLAAPLGAAAERAGCEDRWELRRKRKCWLSLNCPSSRSGETKVLVLLSGSEEPFGFSCAGAGRPLAAMLSSCVPQAAGKIGKNQWWECSVAGDVEKGCSSDPGCVAVRPGGQFWRGSAEHLASALCSELPAHFFQG